jgi:two-component system OmpR family sensor kinase
VSIDQTEPQAPALSVPAVTDPAAQQTSESSRLKLRFFPRTLTARIVTGVLALVLVLVCAVGAATYAMLRSSLYSRLDQQVSSTAGRNTSYFGRCHPAPGHPDQFSCPSPQGPGQTTHEWAALLYPNGAVAATIDTGPLEGLTLSQAQRSQLVRNLGQVFPIHYDGYELRVTAQPNRQGIIVVTGLSTDETEATLNRLVSLEITIGAIALVVAFLATYSGVRFSLRRLRGVTTTAQEVSAELSPDGAGLDRRVPFTEEGTEVGELATSFNTMLAAVETQFAARVASEERMRQFLADASHELRTPLTSIRGYAELARMRRAAGMATGTDDDNLGRIESEGTRMSRLVDDLLMLARGEDSARNPIEREPVDIPSLLDDVVSGSRAAFPDRPIDVAAAPTPVVFGDRDQLLRAVRNLVTNAAVHTEQGRPVRVRGFAEGPEVVITVADGGPGLPPEQAAQVFDRFWRADKARTRARGGSGLGMSIVATIVRAHGGTVRFDSDVAAGSVVTVRLPAAG